MFGLSALEAKLIGIAGILTIALVTLLGFGWHERGVGAQKCETADVKATQAQDQKDAQTLQKQQGAVQTEGITYEQIVAAPPPVGPPVRLCHDTLHPAPVPAAASTGRTANGAPAVPAEAGGDSQRDLGPDLRANARKADAQITGLQAYIRDVCLAPH